MAKPSGEQALYADNTITWRLGVCSPQSGLGDIPITPRSRMGAGLASCDPNLHLCVRKFGTVGRSVGEGRFQSALRDGEKGSTAEATS